MAERGRPAIDNPRNTKVDFRLTPDEKKNLEAYCARKNLTKSQVLKEALDLLMEQRP